MPGSFLLVTDNLKVPAAHRKVRRPFLFDKRTAQRRLHAQYGAHPVTNLTDTNRDFYRQLDAAIFSGLSITKIACKFGIADKSVRRRKGELREAGLNRDVIVTCTT